MRDETFSDDTGVAKRTVKRRTTSQLDLVSTIYGAPTDRAIDMSALWGVINALPEQEAHVMHLMYDDDGHRTLSTQVELAKLIGVSLNQFRGIIIRALRNLRHPNRQRQYVLSPKQIAPQVYSFGESFAQLGGVEAYLAYKAVKKKIDKYGGDWTGG